MLDAMADPKEVFLSALECQSPDELARFLTAACDGDNALRGRVEELLRAHGEAGKFLDGVGRETTTPQGPSVGVGSVVEPYTLVEQIGEGGMGVVFRAEQSVPVHRHVALKIIRPGMDSQQVIARFAAERQALSLMDHPHIARVLDAGTTETGRPYFVMDLVEGTPITDFCDEHRLSIRERLELMAAVCHAVQHAHQKGIIHRDLKPTNILVAEFDGKPQPKVIDFGVAKATREVLTEQSLFTGHGQIIGTFQYMSPEQARFNQVDVDTRSDIYSLGVLMYELLAGSTPFEKQRLDTAAFDEVLRIIREEEPPRPSTRLSTLGKTGEPSRSEMAQGPKWRAESATLAAIAASRQLEPTRLARLIRGELDWIVMQALEKDRNRRYETASALGLDVLHYLTGEPVRAGPPSRLYRARKFVLRNKGAMIASAAVLLGLVAGIIGTTVGLVSQSRQRAVAERERAEVQLNYAVALQSQRKYAEAEALYRRELELASGDTSADRQRAAITRLRLAEVINDLSGAAASEQLHREALAAYREAFAPGDPNIAHALTVLACVLRPLQRFDETELLFREAYEIHRRTIPADHRAIGESASNLAGALIALGRYGDAEPFAREAIAEHELAAPQDVRALAFARLDLGRALFSLRRFSEAERHLLDAEQALATNGPAHHGPIALAALYAWWDHAEPGKGHGDQAQQWFHYLVGKSVRPETATPDANGANQRGRE